MSDFNKLFSELKDKFNIITEFRLGETPEEELHSEGGTIKIKKAQEPHCFEGKTVNLIGDSGRVYDEETIEKYCLEKERVRGAIRKCREIELYFNPKTIKEAHKQSFENSKKMTRAFEELEEELGLNYFLGMEIKVDKNLKENEFRLESQ